jgi:SAM-dependent methyltransferase
LGQEWDKGLSDELQAWEFMLKDNGRNWVMSEYQARLDPEAELQEQYKRLIENPSPGRTLRLLDVGAGPLTSFGKRWKGQTLEILPLDPLANEYNALLTRLGLQPPTPSRPGQGENLLEHFEKNYFDLALASNSLDHSYDPLLIIRHMLTVIRPGCYVYLSHFTNEALTVGYTGLHQWNFSIRKDDMILSDGRNHRYSLKEEFKGVATIECEALQWFGRPGVIAWLKKLQAS